MVSVLWAGTKSPPVNFWKCVRVDATGSMEFSGRYDAPMAKVGVPRLGWLTATLLCLITLWVFWTLRYYGPESTLRQYHQAAARLDRNSGNLLSDPDSSSRGSWNLWQFTVGLMDHGNTRYEVTDVSYQANVASLLVRYSTRQGGEPALIWRVRRYDGNWKVDANQTSLAIQRLLGPAVLPYPPLR